MTKTEDNRIRRLYTMDNLPVLRCIDSETAEKEAIAVANDTDFELAAGVFTQNEPRALRTAKRLETEMVYINEYFAGEMASPFVGLRKAGLGGKEDWRHSLIICGLRMLLFILGGWDNGRKKS